MLVCMAMRALTRVLAKVSKRAEAVGPDPLAQLEALAATDRDVDSAIDREVIRARTAGHTFAAIGTALGVTAQGAQFRYTTAVERSTR